MFWNGRFRRTTLLFGLVAALLALNPAGTPSPISVAQAESNSDNQGNFPWFFKKRKKNATLNSNSNSSTSAGGKATTATEIVATKNVSPMLAPDGASQLRAAADRYRSIIDQGGFPKVGRGSYKKGASSNAIVALNQRLYMDGYLRVEATQGEFASIFTSATEDAVIRFQQNMGLAATGKIDGPTLAALNVPATTRLRTIEANIPRIEAYSVDLGDRYLIVNVPGQQIETVSGGKVYSKHNAIVGRPERPSPVVMTALSDINFNPYWNAPPSIVERDIIPKLRSGTDILREMNIKVFDGVGGPEIDPRKIRWSRVVPDNYHFRQEPGEGNAMATAKINFPSPFGIYLHDTPEKQLFNSDGRFFSSGCVRVQDMSLLVEWVLNGQDGIDGAQIAALAETLERKDVKLLTPPQLRVVYLTAWPTTNGTVAFRNDIYELDGTGFIVGQPMPVGELSADGQRFVLKPLPRQVAELDNNEAFGFSLFGFRGRDRDDGSSSFFRTSTRKSSTTLTKKKKVFGTEEVDDEENTSAAKKVAAKKAKTKTASKAKNGKDKPGLFNWADRDKEQTTAKKKLVAKKKTAKTNEKEVASAEKKDAKGKKAVVKKVDACKADKDGKLPKDCKAAADAKKVADCKPDKDGKLPKGCETAAVIKKPKTEIKPETAAN